MHDRRIVVEAQVHLVGQDLIEVAQERLIDVAGQDVDKAVAVHARLLVPGANGMSHLVFQHSRSAINGPGGQLLAANLAHERFAGAAMIGRVEVESDVIGFRVSGHELDHTGKRAVKDGDRVIKVGDCRRDAQRLRGNGVGDLLPRYSCHPAYSCQSVPAPEPSPTRQPCPG